MKSEFKSKVFENSIKELKLELFCIQNMAATGRLHIYHRIYFRRRRLYKTSASKLKSNDTEFFYRISLLSFVLISLQLKIM